MASLQGSSPVDTPLEVNVKLCRDSGVKTVVTPLLDPTFYLSLLGSLVYLTITRLDISYAVNLISQFMTHPHHLHLVAVRPIIRYILGTSTQGLFYPAGNSTSLIAYSNVNWARCPNTRRSTMAWYMFLGDSLLPWKCKKQDEVSQSSSEI